MAAEEGEYVGGARGTVVTPDAHNTRLYVTKVRASLVKGYPQPPSPVRARDFCVAALVQPSSKLLKKDECRVVVFENNVLIICACF